MTVSSLWKSIAAVDYVRVPVFLFSSSLAPLPHGGWTVFTQPLLLPWLPALFSHLSMVGMTVSGCGSAILLLFYHHHRKKYLVDTLAPHRNALLLSAQPADHSFLTSHSELKRLMLTAAILWLLFPCMRQQEWTDAWSNCEVRAVRLSAKRTRGTDIETDL